MGEGAEGMTERTYTIHVKVSTDDQGGKVGARMATPETDPCQLAHVA